MSAASGGFSRRGGRVACCLARTGTVSKISATHPRQDPSMAASFRSETALDASQRNGKRFQSTGPAAGGAAALIAAWPHRLGPMARGERRVTRCSCRAGAGGHASARRGGARGGERTRRAMRETARLASAPTTREAGRPRARCTRSSRRCSESHSPPRSAGSSRCMTAPHGAGSRRRAVADPSAVSSPRRRPAPTLTSATGGAAHASACARQPGAPFNSSSCAE